MFCRKPINPKIHFCGGITPQTLRPKWRLGFGGATGQIPEKTFSKLGLVGVVIPLQTAFHEEKPRSLDQDYLTPGRDNDDPRRR